MAANAKGPRRPAILTIRNPSRILDGFFVCTSAIRYKNPLKAGDLQGRFKARERECILGFDRLVITLAGTNTHGSFQGCDENLAVADFAGVGGFRNRRHNFVDSFA